MTILRKNLISNSNGVTYGTGSDTYGRYYWIKYGNGLLEQGGIITSNIPTEFTYNFPLQFSIVFQILTTTYGSNGNGATVRNVLSFTETSFRTWGQWGANGSNTWKFSWRAIGIPKN